MTLLLKFESYLYCGMSHTCIRLSVWKMKVSACSIVSDACSYIFQGSLMRSSNMYEGILCFCSTCQMLLFCLEGSYMPPSNNNYSDFVPRNIFLKQKICQKYHLGDTFFSKHACCNLFVICSIGFIKAEQRPFKDNIYKWTCTWIMPPAWKCCTYQALEDG